MRYTLDAEYVMEEMPSFTRLFAIVRAQNQRFGILIAALGEAILKCVSPQRVSTQKSSENTESFNFRTSIPVTNFRTGMNPVDNCESSQVHIITHIPLMST